MRYIPIYRKLNKKHEGYTLLQDKKTEQVYKVQHNRIHTFTYWIAFVIVISIIRSIKGVTVTVYELESVLLLLILHVISGLIALLYYWKTYRHKQEVHYDAEIRQAYIEKGKDNFISEIKTALILLFLYILLFILFIIFGWLISLFFSLCMFGIFIIAICGLPLSRFKLYRE